MSAFHLACARSRAVRSVSLAALAAALLPLFSVTASADCSTTTPASGELVVCTPSRGEETDAVSNSAATDVTVEVRERAAIRPTATVDAVTLGDRARVVVEAGSEVDAQGYGLRLTEDASVEIAGNLLSAGKGSAAINAYDRLDIFIAETGYLEASGKGAHGVRARQGATVRLDGTIRTTGLTDDSSGFRGGAGITANDDSHVVVSRTGFIETLGAGTVGIDVRKDSTVIMNGSIVTRGGPVLGSALNIFPAGIDAQQGATIVVGRSGSIETHGDYASAIDLGGSVDPYTDTTLGDIHVAGRLVTHGDYAAGIGVSAAISLFDPDAERTAPAAYIDIAEGAIVESRRWVGIYDVSSSASRMAVDTTVRVAGSVIGAEETGISIYLAGGDDELVLLPTYVLGGMAIGSQPDGNSLDSPDETDTLTLDGGAGTTGRFAFQENGTPNVIGFERFRKIGAGVWTIDGEAYPDAMQGEVAAGRLSVDADLPSLSMVVGNGAVLGGDGTLGDIFAAEAGTVAPALGGLHSTGGVDISAESRLLVISDGAGRISPLTADGRVFLDGGVLDVAMTLDAVEASDGALIVAAGQGIDGRFGVVRDMLPDIDVTPVYSHNEVRIGYGLDGERMSAKEIHPETISAVLEGELGLVSALRQRAPDGDRPEPTASIAPLAFGPDVRLPQAPDGGAADGGPVVWIDGVAAGHRLEGAGVAGHDASAAGVMAGVGFFGSLGASDLSLGVGGGYTQARIETAHAVSETATGRIGAYAGWTVGPLSLSGAVGYGRARIDTLRDVAGVGIAVSTSDADVYSGSFEAAYDLAPGLGLPEGWTVAPIASLDLAHVAREGFTETGVSALGLASGPTSATRGLAGFGMRFGMRHEVGGGWSVSPSLDLAYQRGLGDEAAATTLSIPITTADFTQLSASAPRDRLAIGASLTIGHRDRLSFSAGYGGSFGSGFRSHTGAARLSYRF